MCLNALGLDVAFNTEILINYVSVVSYSPSSEIIVFIWWNNSSIEWCFCSSEIWYCKHLKEVNTQGDWSISKMPLSHKWTFFLFKTSKPYLIHFIFFHIADWVIAHIHEIHPGTSHVILGTYIAYKMSLVFVHSCAGIWSTNIGNLRLVIY